MNIFFAGRTNRSHAHKPFLKKFFELLQFQSQHHSRGISSYSPSARTSGYQENQWKHKTKMQNNVGLISEIWLDSSI